MELTNAEQKEADRKKRACLSDKKYRDSHREKVYLKVKKYDKEHPEKFALRNKRYKECHREELNQKSKQYNIDNPLKYEAHKIMYCAIHSGKLIKQPCAKCGDLKVHGHHEDYNKPLDVVWLCSKHHKQRHLELLKQKPPNE